jgi:hypothetical protein
MSNDPNSPQAVAGRLTQEEASLLVAHLESLGIKAHIWGANAATQWAEGRPHVQVVVRSADLVRAKEALDRLRRERSDGPTDAG